MTGTGSTCELQQTCAQVAFKVSITEWVWRHVPWSQPQCFSSIRKNYVARFLGIKLRFPSKLLLQCSHEPVRYDVPKHPTTCNNVVLVHLYVIGGCL